MMVRVVFSGYMVSKIWLDRWINFREKKESRKESGGKTLTIMECQSGRKRKGKNCQ